MPHLAVQRGANTAHLVWMTPNASPYTGAYTGYAKSSDGFLAVNRFYLGWYDGNQNIAVKSDGTLYIFYATYGSGPHGTCPSSWEFDYRTSADNFATTTSFGCEIYGYPGST